MNKPATYTSSNTVLLEEMDKLLKEPTSSAAFNRLITRLVEPPRMDEDARKADQVGGRVTLPST